jgi:hypothetical protein
MPAAVATNASLVWLVNNENSSPAIESRNLIRANAAAWGHKTRRHGIRTHARSKVSLAPDAHFNVFELNPQDGGKIHF